MPAYYCSRKDALWNSGKDVCRLLSRYSCIYNEKQGGFKMKKLITIQEEDNLNEVLVGSIDELGAPNTFQVVALNESSSSVEGKILLDVAFQRGPRNVEGSISGVTNEDLLEMVRERLKFFQTTKFACEENAAALQDIENALHTLNKRTKSRKARGVLGTNNK